MFRFWISILLVKGIIQQTNNFARCNGYFHFPFEVLVSGIDKELKPIVFFFKVFQFNNFWFSAWVVHIVHIECAEIAGHDPARVLRYGQLQNVPFGLFKRCQQRPVRLLDGLVQILAQPFLLNQNMGRGNHAINKAGVVEVDLLLKLNELLRVFDSIHITKQRQPERLTFALFVALIFPVGGKVLCGLLLLRSGHSGHLIAQCFYHYHNINPCLQQLRFTKIRG